MSTDTPDRQVTVGSPNRCPHVSVHYDCPGPGVECRQCGARIEPAEVGNGG